MEYRAFGQTGLEVSAIGFGCWEFGGDWNNAVQARTATVCGWERLPVRVP